MIMPALNLSDKLTRGQLIPAYKALGFAFSNSTVIEIHISTYFSRITHYEYNKFNLNLRFIQYLCMRFKESIIHTKFLKLKRYITKIQG